MLTMARAIALDAGATALFRKERHMALIKHVLQRKGSSVWSVKPSDTVQLALNELNTHKIGAVLVMEGARLVGVFSERDLARRLACDGKVDLGAPISQLMTTNVFFAEPGHTVEECMKLMTSKHIRHLPVLQEGKVVGVVSINDLVRDIISDHESTIQSLENFITGQAAIG